MRSTGDSLGSVPLAVRGLRNGVRSQVFSHGESRLLRQVSILRTALFPQVFAMAEEHAANPLLSLVKLERRTVLALVRSLGALDLQQPDQGPDSVAIGFDDLLPGDLGRVFGESGLPPHDHPIRPIEAVAQIRDRKSVV